MNESRPYWNKKGLWRYERMDKKYLKNLIAITYTNKAYFFFFFLWLNHGNSKVKHT